ncbi:MAG: hypothetical protein EDX89_08060 [Acidobacteria bacterium]|nr:MAG: hypothetical protein EDX89_08060 [Acidobacteriota bacterium]
MAFRPGPRGRDSKRTGGWRRPTKRTRARRTRSHQARRTSAAPARRTRDGTASLRARGPTRA